MSADAISAAAGSEEAAAAGGAAATAVVRQAADLPPVTHDIMLRAVRRERVERAPVWAMRQAGRYLPEFLQLRRFDFLERVHVPELAAEITLQPLRRYRDLLDGVVVFSDILIVPPVMGFPVVFNPGPQFIKSLTTPEDLAGARWRADIDIKREFAFLLDAIALTRRMAAAAQGTAEAAAVEARVSASPYAPHIGPVVGKGVPVIGFVGAPWTLMSYMIDGDKAPPGTTPFTLPVGGGPAAVGSGAAAPAAASSSDGAPAVAGSGSGSGGVALPPVKALAAHSKGYEKAKAWLLKWPEASHRLLAGITDILVDLLIAQYEAGATVLQVFETNAEALSPRRFNQFALPYLARIAREVKARVPAPADGGPVIMLFAKGAQYALEALAAETDYDGLSLDWSTDPAAAVATVTAAAARTGKPAKALQGNLDPCELFGTRETIREATAAMVEGFGTHPLVGNLGHGMLPSHTPEALGHYFTAVHEITAAAYAAKA